MGTARKLGSRYELREVIGRGGMGEVWRGRGPAGEDIAVKLLLPQWASDPAMVQRFVAERSVVTGVASPYVVQVRDMVVEGEDLGIVMDFVDGPDLRHHLMAHGSLPPAEVARLGAGMARGLQELHNHGIVHRDVKPENVLLAHTDGQWQPRLTDFGVSRIGDATVHRQTAVVGTPDFMAPEIADGGLPTPQADLYALGVMLYELACGTTPFQGSPLAVMQAHASVEPGRPGGIPDALWQIIQWCLRKDAAARPASAMQLALALEQVAPGLAGLPAAAALVAPPDGTSAVRQATTFTPLASAGTKTVLAGPGGSLPPVPPVQHWAPGPHPSGGVPAAPRTPGGKGFPWLPVVIGVALLALVAFVTVRLLGTDSDAEAAPSLAATAASAGGPGAPQTMPAQPVQTTASPAAPTRRTITLPADSTVCVESGSATPWTNAAAGSSVTSCPFASQVLRDYVSRGGDGRAMTLESYSPTTGKSYTMTCRPSGDVVNCTGGRGALVVIW